ncbi:1,4-dihydroxy-2-naphthoate octaprenyltransferase [Thermodesulfobacteriota bacterium]
MKAYLTALRAPFLTGSIIPVIIGAVLALEDKHLFLPLPFLVTLIGVAALHLGANLMNDYWDAKGSDPLNVRLTPFSGGSRVIQNKEIAPSLILIMSLVFFAIGLICGIWLTRFGRPLVIPLGLLGLAAGWSYSSPPLQLMSRGVGELVIFWAFGPLITLGAYYVIAGTLSWQAFIIGIPQGFLIMAVIWINQFPDYKADREAGKRNLVVRFGPKNSRYFYILMMAAAFIFVTLWVAFMGISYLTMLTFISFPLALKAMRILWKHYLSHEALIPAQALTIQTLLAHGLLLSLGLLLSRFIHV